jgi:hypothetical protein
MDKMEKKDGDELPPLNEYLLNGGQKSGSRKSLKEILVKIVLNNTRTISNRNNKKNSKKSSKTGRRVSKKKKISSKRRITKIKRSSNRKDKKTYRSLSPIDKYLI